MRHIETGTRSRRRTERDEKRDDDGMANKEGRRGTRTPNERENGRATVRERERKENRERRNSQTKTNPMK